MKLTHFYALNYKNVAYKFLIVREWDYMIMVGKVNSIITRQKLNSIFLKKTQLKIICTVVEVWEDDMIN